MRVVRYRSSDGKIQTPFDRSTPARRPASNASCRRLWLCTAIISDTAESGVALAGQCFYLLRNLCRLKDACITTVGLLEDEVRDAGFEIPIYEGDRREIESGV